MIAQRHERCAAGCGNLIRPGDEAVGIQQPDGRWHNVHPGCVDAYERNSRPRAQNAPTKAAPDMVESSCDRCGMFYAGPRHTFQPRCRSEWCDGTLVPEGPA